MTTPSFEEVHIENTNSCRYKCFMCPREQLTRQLGFMSLADFSLVLSRIGAFSGIFHLHGFGEPLLDRLLPEKITSLKQQNPTSTSVIFSTLGVRLQEDFFTRLLTAGLDNLVISFYGFSKDTYQKIHGFDGFTLAQENIQLLQEALKKTGSSCAVCIKIPGDTITPSLPSSYQEDKKQFLAWAQKLGITIREWSNLHNYGEGRTYNLPKRQAPCPAIHGKRKQILNIAWNLDVLPCAYDFNGTIRLGNLKTSSLAEIFSSKEYFSFLLAHANQDLSCHQICQNCERADYE